ncbi:MAG: CYTH domain-containing protein [Candidatus Nanoarchaeia archaeon]
MFEVEKRAFIEEKKVDSLKLLLHKKTKFVNAKKFHTLLYPKPNYLRIRWTDNKKIPATVTVKKGKYLDGYREETEIKVDVKEINSLVKIFGALGYDECSYFKSYGCRYEYKGFIIDLTKHDYLGTMLEIEKMTSNKKEIKNINEQIIEIMNELKLKELSSEKYQKMMNKMYKDSLKSVNSQNILKVTK